MNTTQNELLKKYLLFNNRYKKIKIIVSYIKPSFLFKTEILTPIHLGREVSFEGSKDGISSQENYHWLLKNCIGDNDFSGNISKHNRRVGFFTGTYWAYKNFHILGNPQFFGSFGYRRLLAPVFLQDMSSYDIILPYKINFEIKTLREQFIEYHGPALHNRTLEVLKKIYPNEFDSFNEYMNGTSGYFHEMYVLKKDLFFDFCRWMTPLVFEFLQHERVVLPQNDCRDIGFAIERLTGFYLDRISQQHNTLECAMIDTEKPKINRDNINASLFKSLRAGLK